MPDSFASLFANARSGIFGRLVQLDVVSANLANFNTVGYKTNRVNFQEALSFAQLTGTRSQSSQWNMQVGSLQTTGRPLDLALTGEGFFAVTLPDGQTAYTRDGQFQRDAANTLTTANGHPLVWQGQIPADASEVHVNPDGTVMALQGDTWNQVGQIGLSRFVNPTALGGQGDNLWLPTDASGEAIAGQPGQPGFSAITAYAVESSNINLAEEMTLLTTLQRGYSLSVRAFQQADEMLAQAIQMRRG
jgi:flagellar basal-body rod protein FlgG